MSGPSSQENYWMPGSQPQYNFDNSGFGQPNPNQQFDFPQEQQYDFGNYEQQVNDYGPYLTQQEFLTPSQSAYTSDIYGSDNFGQG